jgi:hypothetical protein
MDGQDLQGAPGLWDSLCSENILIGFQLEHHANSRHHRGRTSSRKKNAEVAEIYEGRMHEAIAGLRKKPDSFASFEGSSAPFHAILRRSSHWLCQCVRTIKMKDRAGSTHQIDHRAVPTKLAHQHRLAACIWFREPVN